MLSWATSGAVVMGPSSQRLRPRPPLEEFKRGTKETPRKFGRWINNDTRGWWMTRIVYSTSKHIIVIIIIYYYYLLLLLLLLLLFIIIVIIVVIIIDYYYI